MLPKGKYHAKARTWDLGETSTGKAQVAVEFEIADGDHKGETITWYGFFTDETTDRTLESLRYMGWVGDDLEVLDGLHQNEVQIVIDQEEYPKASGKWHAKVQWVNRLGGIAMKSTLSTEKRKIFAASMKDRIKAFDAKNPQTKGDVPF